MKISLKNFLKNKTNKEKTKTFYKGIKGWRSYMQELVIVVFLLAIMGVFKVYGADGDNANLPSPLNNTPATQADTSNNPNVDDGLTLEEFQEEQNKEEAVKMQFLNAIQASFFSKKRNPQDNNLNIIYKAGNTPKVRLRYAMTTTFIFDNETIAYVSVGDSSFFEVNAPKKDGYNLSNILIIKPLLIGVDTNLTVLGKSGKIYTFYLFSTHFTNSRNPALTVFISDNRKIGKIDIIPEEVKMQQEKLKKLEELKKINEALIKDVTNPLINQDNSSQHSQNISSNHLNVKNNDPLKTSNASSTNSKKSKDDTPESAKSFDYSSEEIDDGKFIKIGDETNHIYIDKSKIRKHYYQAPRKKRMWWSLWLYKKAYKEANDLQAIDIFDDGHYTYFKYNRSEALSKFPYPYKVVDGYDNPINSRIVGNYIIAEDVNAKWTLRLGDEYVCVQKIPSQKELNEIRLQKQNQIIKPIKSLDDKSQIKSKNSKDSKKPSEK